MLGDYLEAVCVDGLDAAAGALAALTTGRLTLLEGAAASARRARGHPRRAGARAVRDPHTAQWRAHRRLAGSRRSGSARGCLPAAPTSPAAGEWVGRDWLRVSRGTDQRAGVLEREQRLKELRAAAARAAREVSARGGGARWRRAPSLRDAEVHASPRRPASRVRTARTRSCWRLAGGPQPRAPNRSCAESGCSSDAGEVAREQAATAGGAAPGARGACGRRGAAQRSWNRGTPASARSARSGATPQALRALAGAGGCR